MLINNVNLGPSTGHQDEARHEIQDLLIIGGVEHRARKPVTKYSIATNQFKPCKVCIIMKLVYILIHILV